MNSEDDDQKINSLLGIFNSLKASDETQARIAKKPLIFDNAYIDSVIERVKKVCNSEVSDEEIAKLKKRITSTYDVHQEEGDALLGDYNHVDWYPRKDEQHFYWDRYKNYLVNKSENFKATINTFDKNTDKITNYFGDPKAQEQFQVRGLVMGDVQSGKTSTYIGTICKAVDAGYKVVVLLTGMVESLRKQTQTRIDEGFIGYDSVKNIQVGVGIGSLTKYPRALTSSASDYTGSNVDKNTNMAIQLDDPTPLILVCKKNTKVLEKIIKGMKNLNTSTTRKKIDASLLLIDDEADNASINTNVADLDPTAINRDIRNLLQLFTKSTYVGFTATPFANVFIQPDDVKEMLGNNLFPRDFIYSLKAPSDYIGPSSLFFPTGKYHNCLIDLKDYLDNISLFSYSHKKDWDGDRLFPSFYESIITFCLANVIRDLRGETEHKTDGTSHRSMLINMSRFKNVQEKIKAITDEYLSEIKKTARLFGRQPDERALANPTMAQIHSVWEKQYDGKIEFSWDQVKHHLFSSISPIETVVINSSSKTKLDYDAHKALGWRVIAIGGLALSRGLTLEGLIVSYFFRNTSTYDVLMQMGRWFGYRPNYADIVRIWISKVSARWYLEIAQAIEKLRDDITRMVSAKITPVKFGVRVRDDSEELGITAANKMRNAIDRIDRKDGSFYGRIFETTLLSQERSDNVENWNNVLDFCDDLPAPDASVNQPYFRNIPKARIAEFVKRIIVPQISVQFDREQIARFIETNADKGLDNWDVLFVSKDLEIEGSGRVVHLPHDITVKSIVRTCAITNSGCIAVSGDSSHIGSRDTKTGLSAEKIKEIEASKDPDVGTSQRLYMYKGRPPLLIIYSIDPRPNRADTKLEEALRVVSSTEQGVFPAFSVCFPQNDEAIAETHIYKVNKNADYYEGAGFATESGKEPEEP